MNSGERPGGSDTTFYDTVYSRFADPLAARLRAEVYTEDIGQNSWLTAEEHGRFCARLRLGAGDRVIEIGSGAGGPALFMVEQTGCSVVGLELHEAGVDAANRAAGERGLKPRARFIVGDARAPLPFGAGAADVLICIDTINHLFDRGAVFAEWHRVLRPGGRALFTNPLTVSGLLSGEEVARRSASLGEQVFTPPGVDERLLRAAGFGAITIEDATDNTAVVAGARLRARAAHAAEVAKAEGEHVSARYDDYLRVVQRLAAERRLTRPAYLAHR